MCCEKTLVRMSIKPMDTEMTENFMDIFHMIHWVVGEDKNVVKVYNDSNIQ